MTILYEAKGIRKELVRLRPSRIAVGFLGKDWREYVDASALKEIILWPTPPSNPWAIEAVIDAVGIENVHFLDNLHAKIYISQHGAILGSFNLSRNGFGDGGLLEAGVTIDDAQELKRLNECYANYRRKAKRLYPTPAHKRAKLRALTAEWSRAIANGFIRDHGELEDLRRYKIGTHRIHIAWWQPDNTGFNAGKVVPQIHDDNPSTIGEPMVLERYFRDTLRFLEKDNVKCGDWILMWRCNDDGMPSRGGSIEWLYVHHVIHQGVSFQNEARDEYTTLVGESAVWKRPQYPFALTPNVKRAFRATLCSGAFPALIDASEDGISWELGPADAVVARFLKEVQGKVT